MTLTCPHCGYGRDTAPERLPRVPVLVTCPRCRQRFRFAPRARAMAAAAEVPGAGDGRSAVRATAWSKAGFWVRLVAALVDWVLVTGLETILSLLLFAAAMLITGGRGSDMQAVQAMMAWSVGPVLGVAYYVGFIGYCGQTPGKMAIRVKVVRSDGEPVGYGRALLRETLGKFLSGLILGIGYLMIAFDEQKQGLHDKIADTYVVKL